MEEMYQYQGSRKQESQEVITPETSSEEASNTEGGGEQFKVNELIIPEDHLERSKALLRSVNILVEDRKYSERQEIDTGDASESDAWVEAEFILSVKDMDAEDEQSPERIRQAFQFLKDNKIPIRYGRVPGKAG